jgi:hypothetical protein
MQAARDGPDALGRAGEAMQEKHTERAALEEEGLRVWLLETGSLDLDHALIWPGGTTRDK